MSKALDINEANFQTEVLNSDIPVLVDFWAEWCGPCKAIGPELDALSAETEGKLKIVKINVDENNDISAQYGVRSIPTLLLFKNGEMIDSHLGLASKQELLNFTKPHFS
ncbi:MAG: thioredoxin [Cardiobacteriaceae bacterium]|nr:thioredoxin [Cardiobacteriaceae bacterium]